jgi:cellulose synthase/poly-beta-1,6-N-acetylglucosamine synthase-like glycosyltransferase
MNWLILPQILAAIPGIALPLPPVIQTLIAAVLGLGAGVLLLLTGMLLLEVLAALAPGSPWRSPAPLAPELTWEATPVGVIVPAHNEALGIEATLATLYPQLKPQDHLVVVADNCTDATAALAQATVPADRTVTILERWDPDRRGKGYALDYGLKFLGGDPHHAPPAVVIIVDADCHCHPGCLATLTQATRTTGRPTQALYLLDTPPNPNPKTLISAFAMKVKNAVRMRGLARFGWPCPLGGTGMAFPWQALQGVNLATGHIVEDMKLGLDLAIAGYPPLFWGTAQVTGCLPGEESASTSQRTRWEHGHLQILQNYVPHLLGAAIAQKRLDLAIMALDLAIPPLSLLVVLWVGWTGLTAIASFLGISWVPLILGAIAGGNLFIAILGAWAGFARQDLPLHRLLSIPLYILWKIPLYFKFLYRPQSEWVRTKRD